MTEILAEKGPLKAFIEDNQAAVLYFSGDDCNVCSVLLPKVEAVLEQEFPRVALAEINCSLSPELAAQEGVFTVPTIILYFDGREAHRFSRNISLGQLRDTMARPYQLLFE